MEFVRQFAKRVTRCFVAGVLAILPLIITVAVVVWVADFLKGFLGPNTALGGFLAKVGGNYFRDFHAPYIAGWIVALAAIFAFGVLVEFGAKSLFSRTSDWLLKRIPLVGSIYSTSKQVVEMLDKKEDDAIQGMSAVFCYFGDSGTAVLAFLVSPEKFRLDDRDYYIVIIPTAPLPFGGAMLFVPVDSTKPANMPVDGLMSIYLSMGLSAPQFMQATAGGPTGAPMARGPAGEAPAAPPNPTDPTDPTDPPQPQ